MRNIVIGRFKASRQGGWEGEILMLTIRRQIRLVPNDDRSHLNAPSFHVMLGWQQIGEAWQNELRTDPGRYYLRVRIADPAGSLNAILFPDHDMVTANLVIQINKPESSIRETGESADE